MCAIRLRPLAQKYLESQGDLVSRSAATTSTPEMDSKVAGVISSSGAEVSSFKFGVSQGRDILRLPATFRWHTDGSCVAIGITGVIAWLIEVEPILTIFR